MKIKKLKRIGSVIAASALLLLLGSTTVSADYTIEWWTVDGGGISRSNTGKYTLSATVGQPDAADELAGGHLTLTGGFWFQLVPGDCNSDGGVDLIDYTDLEECLFGPGAAYHDTSCVCFDFDADDDVDLLDFAEFQVHMTN